MGPRRYVLALMGIAAALAAVVPIVGAVVPSGAVLPDLVADPPQSPVIANYTYPSDGTQALLLRFDGYVHNIGPGPFEIRASNRSGLSFQTVGQYVSTGTGMQVVTPPPGPPHVDFESGDGHNHWHLQRIARYSLWNEARTAEVAPAMKTGFCLEDTTRRETNGPSSPVYQNLNFCEQGDPSASGLTMGVSAGWRDVYNQNLAFQWVDISDVQPGTYYLAAEIDPENVIVEANETNPRVFKATPESIPGYRATAVDAGTVPAGQASTVTLAAQSFGAPGARQFRIESLPEHGTLRSGSTVLQAGSTLDVATVAYTPASGYSGPDTFTFAARDSASQFPRTPAAAAVSLTVGQQPAVTTVAISGAPATLNVGTSAQLTATVTNAPPGVTWAVNGVAGGNATVGTISSSGLYQAPAAVPAGGTVTIRATSTAVPAAFDQVSVQIVNPGPPDPAPEPGTNFVRNPSFESDLSGWTTWQASLAREQMADAPDGVMVTKVTRTAGTAYTLDDSPTSVTSASAPSTYVGSAFVKAASASSVGKPVELFLRERSAGGAVVRNVAGPTVTLTTSFQRVGGQIQPQAAGNQIEIYLGAKQAVTGDAFYVDQISLTNGEGNPPPPPNQAPTAAFSASTLTPQTGQQVTFTDQSTDPDGTIAARAWDTDGDGQFDDGTGATATATYATAGTVTVSVRVTDNGGAQSTASRTLTVSTIPPPNQAPTAAFSASTLTPQTGQQVTFTDQSTDPDGTIAARAWDTDGDGQFDDGTGATATATYATAGPVTVGLRVTDNGGTSSATTRALTVSAAPGPGSNLVANGSFESSVAGWTTWQASLLRQQAADAPDGAWAVKVTRTAGTAFTIDDSPTTVTSALGGATYVGSAFVKAASPSSVGKPVELFLRERTGAGAVVRNVAGPTVTLTNAFQRVTSQLVPRAAGNQIEIYVGAKLAVAGDAFLLDGVTLGPS